MYEFLQETVATNMTTPARSVAPKTTVRDLYRLFEGDDFDAYPVIRGDKLVGVVSKLDALKVFTLTEDEILPHYQDRMMMPVDAIMTCEVVAVESAGSRSMAAPPRCHRPRRRNAGAVSLHPALGTWFREGM